MISPEVPESLEGWTVLHQMFRMDWPAWKSRDSSDRARLASEARERLTALEQGEAPSACFSLLGHKGDLMLLHFRPSFDDLNATEHALQGLGLWDFLTPTTSYVSVIELGLYSDTLRKRQELEAEGIEPGSPEWENAFAAMKEERAEAMQARLFPSVPERRYLCFYPMDKKRGEDHNWYSTPMDERARMMADHGKVGRTYAGRVQQIISGSIGYDDWEWGVDLFAADPMVFKKLIYEMRFDEASANYGLFGAFYLGLRFRAADLPAWLDGELPAFE